MLKRSFQALSALIVAVATFSSFPTPAAHASGLCYVNHLAIGANDGSSWSSAYTDLQGALENPACAEIWVAYGTYKPTSTTNWAVSFVVHPGQHVYGGFGGFETLRAQRNPTWKVILSGDIDNNDSLSFGVDQHTTDIQGSNSVHVVTMDGTGSTAVTPANTVLDGFTITGGQATGNQGGGLYCDGDGAGHVCSPTLQNLTFIGNFAGSGGAIFDNALNGGTSSPVMTDVTFMNNSADSTGGAIYNDAHISGSASPLMNNVTFSGNSAYWAGAMKNDGTQSGNSSPLLANVTFNGNSSTLNGGAVENDGSLSGTSVPNFANVILWGDTAGGSGNEIQNINATPTIDHSVVQGSGGSGGSWDASLGTDDGGNLDANPILATLQDSGGFTLTIPFLAGSPALNAGNDGNCFSIDQRGVPRPQGPHCDIGAYEHTQFVRAAFNPNRTSDLAVFRPSAGAWYIKNEFNTTWGQSGDVPVPADYNKDNVTEVAVWRPSNGVWYIRGLPSATWGSSGDVPVPGHYNGAGIPNIAVWRPSTGTWYVKGWSTTAWGVSGDIPVPGEYSGYGKTNLAVFRPSTGVWYIKDVGTFTWGTTGDIPVPADYNGDGTTEIAVFRPSTGIWYVKGLFNSAWGVSTDIPVPGDFNGDGHADIVIWRPSTGQWMVKNQFTTTWGTSGDFPLVAPDTNGNGTPYQ